MEFVTLTNDVPCSVADVTSDTEGRERTKLTMVILIANTESDDEAVLWLTLHYRYNGPLPKFGK